MNQNPNHKPPNPVTAAQMFGGAEHGIRGALPSEYQQILAAALEAVDPFRAVQNALTAWKAANHAGDQAASTNRRILVIGAGKAGAPMAQAAEAVFAEQVAAGTLQGLVVVKHGHGLPTQAVRLVEAAHPVPDAAGLQAGAEILRIAESARENDLVIVLISGGGSALLEVLPADITLADLRATTALLLASGATIGEINTLRKHLSRIKGGQLARAAAPATLLTLVLSDVVGSPLDVIASGPTVPDTSTWHDAWQIVQRYALADLLPPAVRARLRRGVAGREPETPKPGATIFARTSTQIVGDSALAAQAALRRASDLGFAARVVTTALEGEAAEVGRMVVETARLQQTAGANLPACLFWAGETTVTLGTAHGMGGRNQELALAAALALRETQGITVIAFATDGTDGPTDSAGGWATSDTVARMHALGLDAEAALTRHDAYPLLLASGNLLKTGPTRTNVNDLVFAFVGVDSERTGSDSAKTEQSNEGNAA